MTGQQMYSAVTALRDADPPYIEVALTGGWVAAEHEPEPQRKGKLRGGAELLSGMARDITVQVIAARLGQV